MRTHYDAQNDHVDFMEGVLDPEDIDQFGNRYVDYDAYKREQDNRPVELGDGNLI